MDGVSTRFAFKVLAATFNYDTTEIAADPVHLMYVLEQSIRREQFPAETREAIPRIHQGRAGAALRRIHRQRDPEGLPGVLPRLRPEPVRPLRLLRRRLDRGCRLQGPRHRAVAQPRAAEPGADQDREAGRHRQPEGLPQRGGEVQPARAGATTAARTRPGPAYEKIREVIERRMFSQVEELLPVISFGSKKDGDTEKKHNEFVEPHDANAATPNARSAGSVEWYMRVQAGRAESRTQPQGTRAPDAHRRSPPQSERQEPRQPPALHARGPNR